MRAASVLARAMLHTFGSIWRQSRRVLHDPIEIAGQLTVLTDQWDWGQLEATKWTAILSKLSALDSSFLSGCPSRFGRLNLYYNDIFEF